jgi:arginyl-tRNA--protein-N-Asp/Glu arginylyltransferase
MTATDPDDVRYLELYLSAPHPCNYLPGRQTVNLVADPRITMHTALYSALIEEGFRRSGGFAYRPHCPGCNACVPVRIPVDRFRPRRAQRRILRRNQDVSVRCRPPRFDAEHFDLYARYLAARHPGGGMDDPSPEDYLRFLTAPAIDTCFYEMRAGERLLGVAVADVLRTGLSAVYTFFDPELADRSPGVYAVLWQIEQARRLDLPYVYLGYWIKDCDKMSYKDQYRPLEGFRNGRWQMLEDTSPSTRQGG